MMGLSQPARDNIRDCTTLALKGAAAFAAMLVGDMLFSIWGVSAYFSIGASIEEMYLRMTVVNARLLLCSMFGSALLRAATFPLPRPLPRLASAALFFPILYAALYISDIGMLSWPAAGALFVLHSEIMAYDVYIPKA